MLTNEHAKLSLEAGEKQYASRAYMKVEDCTQEKCLFANKGKLSNRLRINSLILSTANDMTSLG